MHLVMCYNAIHLSLFQNQALAFTCLQYKSIEYTVGKTEIARNKQFLLFSVFPAKVETFLPFS